jgi:hypothetical protein
MKRKEKINMPLYLGKATNSSKLAFCSESGLCEASIHFFLPFLGFHKLPFWASPYLLD